MTDIWIRASIATGEIYEQWVEPLFAKPGEVSVNVGNVEFEARTHRWDNGAGALRTATPAERTDWDSKFNPPDPTSELIGALTALKGTGATVDQLIDVQLADAGRRRGR